MKRIKVKRATLLLILCAICVVFYFQEFSGNETKKSYNIFFDEQTSIEYVKNKSSSSSSRAFDVRQVVKLFSNRDQNLIYEEFKSKIPDDQLFMSNKVVLNRHKPTMTTKKAYLINEYTRVFGSSKFCHLKIDSDALNQYWPNQALFHREQTQLQATGASRYNLLDDCMYKNCFFTCDRSLAGHSDALLFHQADLQNDLTLALDVFQRSYEHNMIQRHRDASQVWLLWNDEANKVADKLDAFKFNWTMSFNSRSEVSYCAYGCYKRVEDDLSHNASAAFDSFVERQFASRKSVVWFVSNCQAQLRINYVSTLAADLDIDVFGACNSKMRALKAVANQSRLHFVDENCQRDSACEESNLKRHMFYVSFENKNCSYYITEKFWRSLSYNLIPIVLFPSRRFYDTIAPPDSFIHAGDFNYDMNKLAHYIKLVANNYQLYFKYLKWKRKYTPLYKGEHVEKLRICELCSQLNNPKEASYYRKVSSFFNDNCH